MPRFTEEQLNQMCRPASDSEETKLQNAESLLKKALSSSSIVCNLLNMMCLGKGPMPIILMFD